MEFLFALWFTTLVATHSAATLHHYHHHPVPAYYPARYHYPVSAPAYWEPPQAVYFPPAPVPSASPANRPVPAAPAPAYQPRSLMAGSFVERWQGFMEPSGQR